MAYDAYLQFTNYRAKVPVSSGSVSDLPGDHGTYFPIETYAFDITQALNIGSATTGAGAGKIVFNPFSVTRYVDTYTPTLFTACCSGTPFAFVKLLLFAGLNGHSVLRQTYIFKLVALKTLAVADSDTAPLETIGFEYGGLLISTSSLRADGTVATQAPIGWNRVRNVSDTDPTTQIV